MSNANSDLSYDSHTQTNPHRIHNNLPIIALVGPTASGKTALSLSLARALGGESAVEIIAADAMALYRGMDIGTAKPTEEERAEIRHHQIDVLNVKDEASVAVYQKKARADIADVIARGKIPVIVGGSGLYVSAVLDELDFPGTDPALRAHLRHIAHTRGLEPLIEELYAKDPLTARRIDLANERRVIRALEVVRLTGRSYTPVFPRHTSHYERVLEYGLRAPAPWLNPRIEERTKRMFTSGLIEETRGLIAQGLRSSSTAQKATGYAQALSFIEETISLDQAVESTIVATRRLAKKQRTWFKADHRITWLDPADPGSLHSVFAQVQEILRDSSI